MHGVVECAVAVAVGVETVGPANDEAGSRYFTRTLARGWRTFLDKGASPAKTLQLAAKFPRQRWKPHTPTQTKDTLPASASHIAQGALVYSYGTRGATTSL